MRRLGKTFEDFVNVTFAIHDVDQAWSHLGWQGFDSSLGGFDGFEPLIAFLLVDGQAMVLVGGAFFGGPGPVFLVQDAHSDAIFAYSDAGVAMESLGTGGVVERRH